MAPLRGSRYFLVGDFLVGFTVLFLVVPIRATSSPNWDRMSLSSVVSPGDGILEVAHGLVVEVPTPAATASGFAQPFAALRARPDLLRFSGGWNGRFARWADPVSSLVRRHAAHSLLLAQFYSCAIDYLGSWQYSQVGQFVKG